MYKVEFNLSLMNRWRAWNLRRMEAMSAGGGSSLEKNKQNVAFLLLIIFLKFSAEA